MGLNQEGINKVQENISTVKDVGLLDQGHIIDDEIIPVAISDSISEELSINNTQERKGPEKNLIKPTLDIHDIDVAVVVSNTSSGNPKLDKLIDQKKKKQNQLNQKTQDVNNLLNKALDKSKVSQSQTQFSRLSGTINAQLMSMTQAFKAMGVKDDGIDTHILRASKELEEVRLYSQDKGKVSDEKALEKSLRLIQNSFSEMDAILSRNRALFQRKSPTNFELLSEAYSISERSLIELDRLFRGEEPSQEYESFLAQYGKTDFEDLNETYDEASRQIDQVDMINARKAEFYDFKIDAINPNDGVVNAPDTEMDDFDGDIRVRLESEKEDRNDLKSNVDALSQKVIQEKRKGPKSKS